MLNRYEILCFRQDPDNYRASVIAVIRRFKTFERARREARKYADRYPVDVTQYTVPRGPNYHRYVEIYDVKRGRYLDTVGPHENLVLSVGEVGAW